MAHYLTALNFTQTCLLVCLQTLEELKSFRPYRHLLPQSATYIHFPLIDNDAIASDDELIAFVHRLSDFLDGNCGGEGGGEKVKMYLHCWGGHGRSGSVALLLLVKREGKKLDTIIMIHS